MIFARKSDDHLASLVKHLDKLVAEHKDKKFSVFVNFIGEDRDALEATAKEFATEHKIANVPLVVPVENANGPENFGVNPEAELTAILYTQINVKANHAFQAGKLDKEGVEAILADVPRLLE